MYWMVLPASDGSITALRRFRLGDERSTGDEKTDVEFSTTVLNLRFRSRAVSATTLEVEHQDRLLALIRRK